MSYAASVRCPTLLMHGENDPRVRVAEVQGIHAALNGPKALKIFPGLSHQSYVETQPAEWRAAVQPWLAPGTSRGRTF